MIRVETLEPSKVFEFFQSKKETDTPYFEQNQQVLV